MYVPGELGDVNKVLVDVGTGYYIEKTVPEARDFYKRKEAFLNENLSNLSKTITAKRKNLQGARTLVRTARCRRAERRWWRRKKSGGSGRRGATLTVTRGTPRAPRAYCSARQSWSRSCKPKCTKSRSSRKRTATKCRQVLWSLDDMLTLPRGLRPRHAGPTMHTALYIVRWSGRARDDRGWRRCRPPSLSPRGGAHEGVLSPAAAYAATPAVTTSVARPLAGVKHWATSLPQKKVALHANTSTARSDWTSPVETGAGHTP